MSSANFQIRIWSFIDKRSHDKKAIALVGECYIYLNDLLNMSSNSASTTHSFQGQKNVTLDKIIWHDGKHIGDLVAEVSLRYEPFIQQLFAGVMTENGLRRAAQLVLLSGQKSYKNPNSIQLNYCLNKLNDLNAQYVNSNFGQEGSELPYDAFKLKDTVEITHRLLLKTEKQTSISFVYPSVAQMLKVQELFLDIGEALWLKFDHLQGDIETAYCHCFEALLSRGEFDLQNIGFENVDPENHDMKVKVGSRYHRFLIETLSYVLDQLENRAISTAKRNFIEFLLAYCYFRIPDFRHELLLTLSDGLENKGLVEARNNVIKTVLFGWKEEFFDPLEKYAPHYQTIHASLTEALKKNWRKKFESRGIIFFYFVKEWCVYVQKSIVVKNIEWENIPGYDVLVSNFLGQIKTREINKYPDILLESSLSLLANSKLLKSFFNAVLEKTK